MNGADSIRYFFRLKGVFNFEQTQSDCFRRVALDSGGVHDTAPKQLVAAADSKYPSARSTMPHEEILPSGSAHPFQIGDRSLGPGNNQQVEARRHARIAQVVHGNIRFAFERFEIRIVRDTREVYHSNRQWLV